MSARIGILAYGSLIGDPREEIAEATTEVIKDGVTTPFKVEFARTSRTRGGAPTLVPVKEGGAQVPAQIFVLDVSEEEAANRLYRRETSQVGMKHVVYKPRKNPDANSVVIERLKNFEGVDVVLYTAIGANIEGLTPRKLAELAVESACKLNDKKDGITYLIDAIRNGIKTPLSDAYKEEIKRLVGPNDLKEAWIELRRRSREAAEPDQEE